MDNFFDLVAKRESCRRYTGEPVPKQDLLKCIEAARLAPSACNGQPWSFILVTNKELIAAVAGETQQPFTRKAGAFIAILEEKPVFKERLGMIIKDHDFVQMDIGIAASHICLAATELGLSTCMLGWFREDRVKAILSIPQSKRLRLLICVGHASMEEVREKRRKSMDTVLTVME